MKTLRIAFVRIMLLRRTRFYWHAFWWLFAATGVVYTVVQDHWFSTLLFSLISGAHLVVAAGEVAIL